MSARAVPAAPVPIPLHPAVGDTLDAREASRFGLLADVTGLREAYFLTASWGGYLVRMHIVTPEGPVWRERNVPSSTWLAWRQHVDAVLAGAPVREARTDTTGTVDQGTDRIRVWPEVPLPPTLPRSALRDTTVRDYAELSGHWFVILEGGYKRNVSDFREYFTDQGLFGICWGRLYRRMMPFFNIEFGFGDIHDQFERFAGDGRANTYNFSLGLMVRQPVSPGTHLYISGAFGYYIRSLNWGDPIYDTLYTGYVLEQQDWGQSFRAGVQLWRKGRSKPRFIDIGVGFQSSRADTWNYGDQSENPSIVLRASDRDTWVTLSVRFGDAF
jgi:hypothetical protein